MQGKAFIIPILIIALVGITAAPPAQAELATVTALLAAGFITTVLVVETIDDVTTEPEGQEQTSEPPEKNSDAQARLERSAHNSGRR
jgi:hypothetical protein